MAIHSRMGCELKDLKGNYDPETGELLTVSATRVEDGARRTYDVLDLRAKGGLSEILQELGRADLLQQGRL